MMITLVNTQKYYQSQVVVYDIFLKKTILPHIVDNRDRYLKLANRKAYNVWKPILR